MGSGVIGSQRVTNHACKGQQQQPVHAITQELCRRPCDLNSWKQTPAKAGSGLRQHKSRGALHQHSCPKA
jgi:hypothetical protein